MNRHRLMTAIPIMARLDSGDELAVEKELIAAGFTEAEAFRLAVFVPMAFSRPILEKLGISDFSPWVAISDADGRSGKVRLSDQPEYVAALSLARAGEIDSNDYREIAQRSAEINMVNRALRAGEEVEGSSVASALISPRASTFVVQQQRPFGWTSFVQWIRSLRE